MKSGYRLDVSDDRTETVIVDILDAIIAEGPCKACGTPWAFVVKIEGATDSSRSKAAVRWNSAS